MSRSASPPLRLEIVKGADDALSVGGLRIVACRREVRDIDGGVTVNVFRDLAGEKGPALLRIDLFRKRPHYHAPAENPKETAIEADAGEALAWGVRHLAHSAAGLVREAGFPEFAEGLDTEALAASEAEFRALFAGLDEPSEVSFFEVPPEVAARLRGPQAD